MTMWTRAEKATLWIIGYVAALIWMLALATPAHGQTISKCGTSAIAKASNNSLPKLTTELACWKAARGLTDAPIATRVARIAVLTPPPVIVPPVKVPPVVTPPAPAKIAIGMNLAPLNNSSAELPFIDYLKLGGDPMTGTLSIPVAIGEYDLVLLYDGSLVPGYEENPKGNSVGWNSMFPTSFTPGRIVFHTMTGGSVNFRIAHVDPADPIRNMHLVRASDEAAFKQGAIFNPDFLAFIKGFSPLRTMDWSCTNGSLTTSWSQRPKPTDAVYGCAPIEVQVALANQVGSDLWLNIPARADDDYITQATTYVRDHLAPGLKLHLEYSNETWNDDFDKAQWKQSQADKLWGNGQQVAWGKMVWSGYRAAQMMAITQRAYGADFATRVSGVLGTFPGWGDSQVDDALALGVSYAKVGSIASLFREYAVTTYFGDSLGVYPGNDADRPTVLAWATSGPAGLDKAFQEIEHGGLVHDNYSLDWRKSSYVRHAAQAKAWGLPLVAYEGGLSAYWFASDHQPELTDFFKRLVADPRMGTLYTRMRTDLAEAGGTALVAFNDVGPIGPFGPWGSQVDLSTLTPRSAALRAANDNMPVAVNYNGAAAVAAKR